MSNPLVKYYGSELLVYRLKITVHLFCFINNILVVVYSWLKFHVSGSYLMRTIEYSIFCYANLPAVYRTGIQHTHLFSLNIHPPRDFLINKIQGNYNIIVHACSSHPILSYSYLSPSWTKRCTHPPCLNRPILTLQSQCINILFCNQDFVLATGMPLSSIWCPRCNDDTVWWSATAKPPG